VEDNIFPKQEVSNIVKLTQQIETRNILEED